MVLHEVRSQFDWDSYIKIIPQTPFTQSWAWGVLQTMLGKSVRRLLLLKVDQPVAVAQAIFETRHGAGYWFVPRGPVLLADAIDRSPTLFNECLQLIEKHLLRQRALFLRIEPTNSALAQSLEHALYTRGRAINPTVTRLIDLTQSVDALLNALHQKTRYNLRLGERQGITVRESVSESDIDHFVHLNRDTATRDNFLSHDDDYLRATFCVLVKHGLAKLRCAELDGQPLAINMEIGYGDTLTYLHGASSSEKRHIKAPNVIQWSAITSAKQAGYHWYDLWGCNPVATDHSAYKAALAGVSHFKAGWGGQLVEYAGTWNKYRWPWLKRWL